MKHISFDVPDEAIQNILGVLTPFVDPKNIMIYSPVPVPAVDDKDAELNELAKKIVEAVRPKPNQERRHEALRAILGGHDSYLDQKGEPDSSLRNAIGHISKSLKSIFPFDKGASRLAIPIKTYFEDGYSYRGTVYKITPLGERVKELLIEEGVI